MILLHRLFAHNFKQLTDVTLHLPAEGTVLIEGNNEAGKSSLFEAAFFALYGRPLLTDRDYTLSDLRRYGTDALEVELDFSIADTRLSITRRVGKNHTAKLIVTGPDTSETINSLSEVRRRLREELRLSDDALLNTCYVEQKRLERLEDLDAANRRATINDLLNLRVLTELENKFKVTRDDRDALQLLKARLEVARLDAEFPALQQAEQKAHQALLYAQVLEADERRKALQHDIGQVEARRSTLEARRSEIAAALQHHASLQLRLSTLESDNSLRLRAWREALEAQYLSQERLRELQIVAGELPQRRARLQEWQLLAARLAELETLEASALAQQAEVTDRRQSLAQHEQILQEWQQGEAQQQRLTMQIEQGESDLQAAVEAVRLRQQANQRSARLSLFLQHAKTHERLLAAINDISEREQAAHQAAAALPLLEEQLNALQQAEDEVRRREDAQRLLERSEFELRTLQGALQESEALKSRQEILAARRQQLQQKSDAAESEKRKSSSTSIRAWSTLALGAVALALGILTGYTGVLGLIALLLIVSGIVSVVQARHKAEQVSAQYAGVLKELNSLEGEQRVLASEPSTDETALTRRTGELQQQIVELRDSPKNNDTCHDIKALHEQRNELLAARAAAQAAQQTLATLRQNMAGTQQQVQAEAAQLETLAVELGLSGGVDMWRQSAQAQQSVSLHDSAQTPDAILQEFVEQKRHAVAGLQHQQAILANEQARRQAELDAHSHSQLEADLAVAQDLLRAITARQEAHGDVRLALESFELPAQHTTLQTHLALVEQRLDQADDLVRQMPALQQEAATRAHLAAERRRELEHAWAEIAPDTLLSPEPVQAIDQLATVRAATIEALTAIDATGLALEDTELADELTGIERTLAAMRHPHDELLQDVRNLLTQLSGQPDEALSMLPARVPELASIAAHDVVKQAGVLQEAQDAVRDNRSRRRHAAEALGLDETPLDMAAIEAEMAAAEQALAVKRRAGEIVVRTRGGIVGRVMPLTMQNMRRLLPLLTDGRYQDAEWDEENNVIAVYDNFARAFQRKRVFSGGARDQISLALRLAFALATLPGEHNIRPGWLFLDEPLSSFDRPRTLALVELLTRGLIRHHFSQIFLVSHSESFDPTQFDYRLRMAAGRVVESTLPRA